MSGCILCTLGGSLEIGVDGGRSPIYRSTGGTDGLDGGFGGGEGGASDGFVVGRQHERAVCVAVADVGQYALVILDLELGELQTIRGRDDNGPIAPADDASGNQLLEHGQGYAGVRVSKQSTMVGSGRG